MADLRKGAGAHDFQMHSNRLYGEAKISRKRPDQMPPDQMPPDPRPDPAYEDVV